MHIWIAVAVGGGLIFLGGMYCAVLQYRRGRLDRREFYILVAMSSIVVLVALAGVLFTDSFSGCASLLFVLWLCVMFVLQSRQHRREEQHIGRIHGRDGEE